MKRCLVVLALAAVIGWVGQAIAQEAAPAPAAMQEVESTMIKEVGYDAAAQVLTVVFATTNEKYAYSGVPEDVYKALMAAESKGSFFAQNIKGKYEFKKVE